MIKSEQINELATALVKAQIAIGGVKKASKAFGYNYANLEAVIDAVKEPLNNNGLSFIQLIEEGDAVDNNVVKVTTLLIHTSGQYIGSTGSTEIPEMKGCNLAQRAGAAQSYLKRYQLQALTGLPTEDNDASSDGFEANKSFSERKASASEESKTQTTTAVVANTNKPTSSFKRPTAKGAI